MPKLPQLTFYSLTSLVPGALLLACSGNDTDGDEQADDEGDASDSTDADGSTSDTSSSTTTASTSSGNEGSTGSGGSTATDASSTSSSSSSGSGTATSDTTSSGTSTSGSTSTGDPSSTTTGDSSSTTTGDSSSTSDTGTDTGGGEEVWELRVPNYSIPPTETFYACFSFNIDVEQLHHIVGFRAVVDSALVHHYVLSQSDTPTDIDPNTPCFEWPADIIWGWAPGGPEFRLPDDAGFMAGETGSANFILQVHYNNPLETAGQIDSSGVDVIVTKDLREHDAGVFSQGDIASLSIPAGNAAYAHVATCTGSQTSALLGEPITVFAAFLHAHQLGKQLWTELHRASALVTEIARDDDFSFDSQGFVATSPITVMPGDELRTTCVYDSTGQTQVTPGGPASNQEMCIDFMMYYPKLPAQKCGSL